MEKKTNDKRTTSERQANDKRTTSERQANDKRTMTELDKDAVKQNLKALMKWSGEEPKTLVSKFEPFMKLHPINPKGKKMDHDELFDYYEAIYDISVDKMAIKLQNSKTAEEKQNTLNTIHHMLSKAQEPPLIALLDLDENHKIRTLGLLAMLTNF